MTAILCPPPTQESRRSDTLTRSQKPIPDSPGMAPAPAESAKAAGLQYVTDALPGIRRQREGDSFTYISPEGRIVRDPDELARINSLGIPPAWSDVWICP